MRPTHDTVVATLHVRKSNLEDVVATANCEDYLSHRDAAKIIYQAFYNILGLNTDADDEQFESFVSGNSVDIVIARELVYFDVDAMQAFVDKYADTLVLSDVEFTGDCVYKAIISHAGLPCILRGQYVATYKDYKQVSGAPLGLGIE